MKWTREQEQAIKARGGNLLVSAAAGSGKTAVVTQRAIDLIINEDIDISRILMITFTDAAAMEMRSRLGSRLLKEINKGNEVKKLSKQLEKLNDSNISTVHAYCISLLRRNYHSADIDPNFTILGEDAINYQMRAINKVLDERFENKDKDFLELCDTLGGRGGENIEKIALELYNFARTQPDYINLINNWTYEFNLDEDEIMQSQWAVFLMKMFTDSFVDMQALAKKAKEYCTMDGGPEAYITALDSDIRYFDEAMQSLSVNDFDKAKQLIQTSRFMTLPRKKRVDDELLIDMVKSLRESTKKLNSKLKSSIMMLPTEEITKRHKHMYPAICALRDIIIDFDTEYKKIKKRRRQLDFADLQHLALEALKSDVVADSEKKRFDYIFVDEYQDTNKLQECIIKKITSNSNLLCVGDVKQSIYAFRQADPNLFLERKAKSSVDEKAKDRVINLNKNFRSSPAVIDSINLVFDTVMSSRLGQVEYDKDERLYSGALRPSKDDLGSCELIIIDEQYQSDENMDSSVEREAYIVAKKIKEFMGKHIWDGKKGIMRPVRYSDICILSKSFKPSVIKVRRVLEQLGIPVMPAESGEYFDEVEVGQTIDILTVIDNKRRDKELISAMASPAFGFDIDNLLSIRKAFNERQSFYQCILKYADIENSLGKKVKEFLEKLNYYKDLSRYITLKDFIWQVLDESGLYNAVGALPGGATRQGNMRLLLDRAGTYSKMPGASLHGFLSYITRLKNTNASIGAESSSDDNAVKFMSIHKSKGLEFPIVFVIKANSRPSDQDTKKTVMTYKNLGFATKYYNSKSRERKNTLSAEAVSRANLQSIYSEEMRVYYVALTRAKEKLVVIGSTKKGDSIQKIVDKWAAPFIPSQYFGHDATLLNYMGCGALRNLSCGNIRMMASIPPESSGNVPNFIATIIPANSISIDRTKRAGAVANAMKECNTINTKRRFIDIQKDEDVLIPSKTTATAIMQDANVEHQIPFETLNRPKFVSSEKVFTSAEKGTMTHKVLEQIDFDCKDIKALAQKLEKRGILQDGAKDVLHYDWIEKFLSSDIIRRAKQSPKVQREVPFVVKRKANELYEHINSDKDVLIQGIIDMCFLEDDRWVIIDYKTNKVTPKNTKKMILDEYKTQLNIYKQALEDITGKKVSQVGLYLLSASDVVWL